MHVAPAQQAALLHARRGGPPGPATLDTRFVLEDAPFGLGFSAAVAPIAGVGDPLTDACLDVLSSLWGRNLVADNDILPRWIWAGSTPQRLSASRPRVVRCDPEPPRPQRQRVAVPRKAA